MYFTSIREAKGRPFTIRRSPRPAVRTARLPHPYPYHSVRFKIICDDGRVISLKDDLNA